MTDERIRERARALLGKVLFDLEPDAVVKLYASMSDPIWADGKHCGDCTKQPMSCNRCFVEDIENWLDDVESAFVAERDAATEQCCRDVCRTCNDKEYFPAELVNGHWTHFASSNRRFYYYCKSASIRTRVAAQGEPTS